LKTYRYDGSYAVNLPGMSPIAFTFRGWAVAPNRGQMEIEAGGLTAEAIYIGDDIWMRAESGAWEKGTNDSLSPAPRPEDFCIYSAAELEKADIKGSRDKVNGVAAIRYEVSSADLAKLAAVRGGATLSDISALVGTVRMSMWVTEKEKWPLRLTIVSERATRDAGSFNAQLNISDFNKNDIKVEAPR
jgi:hypothetical protein